MPQLVAKVVARVGSVGERVIGAMREINAKREIPLDLEFCLVPGEGPATNDSHLFLKEVSLGKLGKSYSLCYRRLGEMLVMSVGKSLPSGRIAHVASSILAMIARGTNWKGGQEAYGPTRVVKPNRGRRRKGESRLFGNRVGCGIWSFV